MPSIRRALPAGVNHAREKLHNVLGRDHPLYEGQIMGEMKRSDKHVTEYNDKLRRHAKETGRRPPAAEPLPSHKMRQNWEEGVQAREDVKRTAHAIRQSNDRAYGRAARIVTGVTVGTGAVTAGAAEGTRALTRRQNERMRGQLVRKVASRDVPFMQDARVPENGAHKVTLMGEKEATKEAFQGGKPGGGRWSALGRKMHANPGKTRTLMLAGSLGIAAPSLVRSQREANENNRLARQIRSRAGQKAAATRKQGVTKKDNRHQQGAAMAGTGVAIGGTGLIAGGIPGVREPNGNNVWLLRGKTKKQRKLIKDKVNFPDERPWGNSSPLHHMNVGHNARKLGPLPRAGILGYRANVHDGFIEDSHNKLAAETDPYKRARLEGKIPPEHQIVRGMRTARRASYGLTIGGAALTAAGVHRMKHDKKTVKKRDTRRGETASAAAMGGGATVGAIGHFAPKGTSHFDRKYSRAAQRSTLEAEKLAPHFGGLKIIPAKVNPEFGTVIRPAKTTRDPARTDGDLHRSNATARSVKGGRASMEQAMRHRGAAAQQRHFAEVFESTGKMIRRFRGPGLAVAGAGGAAHLAYRDRDRKVGKRDWGYNEKRVSPVRATEAAVGISLFGWGASRSGAVRGALAYGMRKPGNVGVASRHAERAAAQTEALTGRGAQMLRQHTNYQGRGLRPVEAAVGGALLAHNALPVRRERFTPVQQGW